MDVIIYSFGVGRSSYDFATIQRLKIQLCTIIGITPSWRIPIICTIANYHDRTTSSQNRRSFPEQYLSLKQLLKISNSPQQQKCHLLLFSHSP